MLVEKAFPGLIILCWRPEKVATREALSSAKNFTTMLSVQTDGMETVGDGENDSHSANRDKTGDRDELHLCLGARI
jgi:hypothetical protein